MPQSINQYREERFSKIRGFSRIHGPSWKHLEKQYSGTEISVFQLSFFSDECSLGFMAKANKQTKNNEKIL